MEKKIGVVTAVLTLLTAVVGLVSVSGSASEPGSSVPSRTVEQTVPDPPPMTADVCGYDPNCYVNG